MKTNTFYLAILILSIFFFSTTAMAQQVAQPDLSKGEIAGVWESYDEAGNKTVIDFSPYFYFKVTTDVGGESMGAWKIENGNLTLDFWTMNHTMSGPVEEFLAPAVYVGPTQHIEVPAGMSMDAFNNTINMQMNRTQQMHMNTMEMIDDMSGSDDYDYYLEDDNGNTYGKDW